MANPVEPEQGRGKMASKVTLVQTSHTTAGRGTSTLVRTRLRILAFIILAMQVIWVARTAFVDPPGFIQLQLVAILLVGMIAALLASPVAFSKARVRQMELALIAVIVGRIAVQSYLVIRVRTLSGQDLLAVTDAYNTVIAISALIVAYGMLVPNTWRRALTVSLLMAGAAPLTHSAFQIMEPEAHAALDRAIQTGMRLDMSLALAGAVALGTSGTQIIYALRRQAVEARDMGQYQLQERIAVGGMGEIWRASHRFLARPAAIKVIQPDKVDPLDRDSASLVLERFEKEAQATATLESLHTVRVYDFGRTDSGEFYYAMELLKGLDVEDLVERFGPLAPGRAVQLLLQACDSLSEAHELGQVHRDVKPSNLFLCKVGRAFDVIKVLDFGLVTRAGNEEASDARLQEEGMAGTPAYMAPEQVLAVTTIDERADIYALGCVAYWMVTGHTVFDIERPIAMAVAHVKAPPMPPSRRTELPIPRDLEAIIMQCLEKQPERRPASAEALANLLGRCDCASEWTRESARDWWLQHRPLDPA